MIECKIEPIEKESGRAARISGELTIYTVSEAGRRLMELLSTTDLTDIDLGGVTAMDTAGLQLLVSARKTAFARHARLRFRNHSDSVLRMLDASGLAGWFGDKLVVPSHRRSEFPFKYGVKRRKEFG